MSRQNRASWIGLVGEYERGELSQSAFAASRGVSVATLRSWIYRLRREDSRTAQRLLPVRVVRSTAPTARRQGEAEAGAPCIEVALPDGVVLRVVGARPAFVADLLARLRAGR